MLDAASESYGECIGIADSQRGTSAAMQSAWCTQAVNPQGPFHRIELDGIFQIGHPASVHLLVDLAFVADVAMAAALVERREDPLHFRRAVTGGHQPGTFRLMSVEISHRIRRAALRKPGMPRLEPPHRPRSPLPARPARLLPPPRSTRDAVACRRRTRPDCATLHRPAYPVPQRLPQHAARAGHRDPAGRRRPEPIPPGKYHRTQAPGRAPRRPRREVLKARPAPLW
jgi:hypothetical protein